VFWDIDGTLLNVRGAGRRAFIRALRQTLGRDDDIAYIHFSGATDLDVLDQILRRHRLNASPDRIASFFAALADALRDEVALQPPVVCPGVRALLQAMESDGETVLGLVTGNTEACARIKLDAAGLHGPFLLGAYGHEHGNRSIIARLAWERARRHLDDPEAPRVLIGDTPADITAARTIGARALAVATGQHPAAELRAAGAELVLPDLRATDRILAWIRGGTF
jgi:phosphoglycolate phosphatase-like HAD superfamily hydrolase